MHKRGGVGIVNIRTVQLNYFAVADIFLQLVASMERICGAGKGRVVSLLEGGYDVSPMTMGLSRCVTTHVQALRDAN